MKRAPLLVALLKMDRILSVSGATVLSDDKYRDRYTQAILDVIPPNPQLFDTLDRWQKSVLSRNPSVMGMIGVTESLLVGMIDKIVKARSNRSKQKLVRVFAIIITITLAAIVGRDVLVVAGKNLQVNQSDASKIQAGVKFYEKFMRTLVSKLGGRKRTLNKEEKKK